MSNYILTPDERLRLFREYDALPKVPRERLGKVALLARKWGLKMNTLREYLKARRRNISA